MGAVMLFGCGDSGTGSTSGDDRVECVSEACDECCLDGECASFNTCDDTFDPVTVLLCDGPEDCGSGETCCAGLPAGALPIRAECTAAAECNELPAVQYLCHTDEDCGGFGVCSPWDFADYVSACE